MDTDNDLLTLPEAALLLRTPVTGVCSLIRAGRLPVVVLSARRRRIRRMHLIAILDGNAVLAARPAA